MMRSVLAVACFHEGEIFFSLALHEDQIITKAYAKWVQGFVESQILQIHKIYRTVFYSLTAFLA